MGQFTPSLQYLNAKQVGEACWGQRKRKPVAGACRGAAPAGDERKVKLRWRMVSVNAAAHGGVFNRNTVTNLTILCRQSS
jgi:hypothetical protein